MSQLNKNTQAYKNKLEYIVRYKKENTKMITITFYNNEEDKAIRSYLDEVVKTVSKNSYIKNLIKEDMKRQNKWTD